MDPGRESRLAPHANQPLGLGRGEQAVLDGDVVELGDALLDDRGKHLAGDEVGVGLPGRGAAVSRSDVSGHDVSAEECDDEFQWCQPAGVFEQSQLAQLLVRRSGRSRI